MCTTRRPLLLLTVILMCAACPPPAPPNTPVTVDPPPSTPEIPAWLEGTWRAEKDGTVTEERWWRLHKNLMVGLNRTVKGGQEVTREHLQLHVSGNLVWYTAWPAGQQMTRFAMVNSGRARAVFENLEHDFPQVIDYRLQDGKLDVEIRGKGGKEARWRWEKDPTPVAAPLAPVVRSVEVLADLDLVWKTWTTREGVESFFAPKAKVEAYPGGAFEMYFMQDAPKGKQGSEGCVVVALEPERSLAYTWNFPPTIPSLRDAHTLVTVNFEKGRMGGTLVTIKHDGFQAGADWTEGRSYFGEAWETVLKRLKRRFEKVNTRPDK